MPFAMGARGSWAQNTPGENGGCAKMNKSGSGFVSVAVSLNSGARKINVLENQQAPDIKLRAARRLVHRSIMDAQLKALNLTITTNTQNNEHTTCMKVTQDSTRNPIQKAIWNTQLTSVNTMTMGRCNTNEKEDMLDIPVRKECHFMKGERAT